MNRRTDGHRARENRQTYRRTPAQTAREARLESLFLAGGGGHVNSPHLDRIPDEYAAEVVVFDWLAMLLERGGFKGAIEAIRYYRNAGWYTDAVEMHLLDYLRGLPAADGSERRLDVTDHQDSLVYLSRLAALR